MPRKGKRVETPQAAAAGAGSGDSSSSKKTRLMSPGYDYEAMHADVEAGKVLGFYGGPNSCYHALAEAKAGTDLASVHARRSKDEFYIESLDRHLKKPHTQRRWKDIVTLDPLGMWASRPTMAATTATMYIDEIKGLKPDGVVVKEDGGIKIIKVGIEYVWNIPGISERLGIDEQAIREALVRYTHNPDISKKTDLKAFLPPIGGLTVYLIGDVDKLADRKTEVAVRVHDECNGSDVFGTDICTCRPYLLFAVKGAVECAQRGGVGVIVYFRKEGRALGEVTKFRVYNARKKQEGGDRPEKYFYQTESIAGIRDARFQELMPDVLLWLGITRIDWLMSMSNEKFDAITAAGIAVMQRISIPDDMVPNNAWVELNAKVASGYHADSISSDEVNQNIKQLSAVRERCNRVFALAKKDKLAHFELHLEKLDDVVNAVVDLIKSNYPNPVDIPYHSRLRHYELTNSDGDLVTPVLDLAAKWPCDELEKTRRLLDLITVSVLLDAGAGPDWKYVDAEGNSYVRSEGLAIAALDMFMDGKFSSDPAVKHRVNSVGLRSVTVEDIMHGFQVSKTNQLIGVGGRHGILTRLADALDRNPEFFGTEITRPGNVLDYLLKHCSGNSRKVSIQVLWRAIIDGLELVWPTTLSGVRRGDVWVYHPLKQKGVAGSDLVPFHKLSQWLLLSLLEPLQQIGFQFEDMDQCTALAEYRNGGVFVDLGVLKPRDSGVYGQAFDVGSELVVEWRACTVCLVDICADRIRSKLKLTAAQFPLPKVLQGGTWLAGRRAALERRSDGSPPIKIRSDGTVF